MHMKGELEREHERKMTEMREAARRMKDDCTHQVEMERFSNIIELFLCCYLIFTQFTCIYDVTLSLCYPGKQLRTN